MKAKLMLIMQKNVTIFHDINEKLTEAISARYKDLPQILSKIPHDEIEVKYVYGQAKRRVKQLEELGYRLKETIWYNDHADWATIRQIWEKAKPEKKTTTKKTTKKNTKKSTTKKTTAKKTATKKTKKAGARA